MRGRARLEDQRDAPGQFREDVRAGRRADAPETVGARRGQRSAETLRSPRETPGARSCGRPRAVRPRSRDRARPRRGAAARPSADPARSVPPDVATEPSVHACRDGRDARASHGRGRWTISGSNNGRSLAWKIAASASGRRGIRRQPVNGFRRQRHQFARRPGAAAARSMASGAAASSRSVSMSRRRVFTARPTVRAAARRSVCRCAELEPLRPQPRVRQRARSHTTNRAAFLAPASPMAIVANASSSAAGPGRFSPSSDHQRQRVPSCADAGAGTRIDRAVTVAAASAAGRRGIRRGDDDGTRSVLVQRQLTVNRCNRVSNQNIETVQHLAPPDAEHVIPAASVRPGPRGRLTGMFRHRTDRTPSEKSPKNCVRRPRDTHLTRCAHRKSSHYRICKTKISLWPKAP